jgi:hypothetical protein
MGGNEGGAPTGLGEITKRRVDVDLVHSVVREGRRARVSFNSI